MTSAVVTFILSMSIVLGAYAAFVILPEQRASRRLRGRLRPETPEVRSFAGLTRTTQPLSAVKYLDAVLTRSGGMIAPLRHTVEHSGLSVTIGLVLLATVFAWFLGAAILQLTVGVAWISVVAGCLVALIPYGWVKYSAAKRLALFDEQFPQAMDLIAGALRAGHAFTTAVSMVADEVQDPTGAEFRLIYDQQNYGRPLPDALKGFAQRVPLLDARFFITAVLTQREAGGNLAEVLDNLAGLIRERARVRRQVRVASAHGRVTGWVLSLMPPALAAIMVVIAPEHMRAFIDDPLGVRMVIAAIVLQMIGTLAIRRIVNVEF